MTSDRGTRTSRLAMVGTLFAIVWGAIYAGITFLGLLGFVIGTFTALIGTMGGVGLVVLFGWFVVNLFSDAMYGRSRDYQVFRQSGGDPYFDWTWFFPLNTDSDETRNTGGMLIECPNCGQFSHRHTCHNCNQNDLDYVRCSGCQRFSYDPGRAYESHSGIICAHCGAWLRDPNVP